LLTPTGRLTWMCVPRIDSPALFADLLGGPEAGYWSIEPAGEQSNPIAQSYRDHTMTVETRWESFTVIDFLDCSNHRVTHAAGRTDLVRSISGFGEVRIEFAP